MLNKPWLWLPPQWAHDLSPWALKIISKLSPKVESSWDNFIWRNLKFSNRIGIAGGVDKNGSMLCEWQHLGCGFLEVGTVTPKPQIANPGKILSRDIRHEALWNKMGFPNSGSKALAKRLLQIRSQIKVPLFVNIGKNRDTPIENAHSDYIKCITELESFADAFVINISSPNTKGLRNLLGKEWLSNFLEPILKHKNNKPLLLKLSPDMENIDIENAIDVSLSKNISGWILTNTTLARPNQINFPLDGGLSGKPLNEISKNTLTKFIKILGDNKKDRLIISAGGVSSYDHHRERLNLGADLVQVYSALIFKGPFFFKHLQESNSKAQ